jgi:hypothetical protein
VIAAAVVEHLAANGKLQSSFIIREAALIVALRLMKNSNRSAIPNCCHRRIETTGVPARWHKPTLYCRETYRVSEGIYLDQSRLIAAFAGLLFHDVMLVYSATLDVDKTARSAGPLDRHRSPTNHSAAVTAARLMGQAANSVFKASTSLSMSASVCSGVGVKRRRSVPRGTVG